MLLHAVVPYSSGGDQITDLCNGKIYFPTSGDAPYSRIISPYGPAMAASGTTTRLRWTTNNATDFDVFALPMTYWGVLAFLYTLEGGGASGANDQIMAEIRGKEDLLKADFSGTGDYAGSLHFARQGDSTWSYFRSPNGLLVPGQWYVVAAKFGGTEDDVELWLNGQKQPLTKEGSGFLKQFGRQNCRFGGNLHAMAVGITYKTDEIPMEAKLDPWWPLRPSAPEVFSIPFEIPAEPAPDPDGLAPHFGKFDQETTSELFLNEASAAESFEAQLLEEGQDPVDLVTSIDSGRWMVTFPDQAQPKKVGVRVRAAGSAWVSVPGGFEFYSSAAPSSHPDGSALILLSRLSGPDPCGVVASASGSAWAGVAKPFHHLAYLWDFGDEGGYLNQVWGPVASHVYETPGTYTVKLRVFRPGVGFAEASAEVAVLDQEAVFEGKTWVFANSADFTGKPAGAVEVVTSSWNSVLSYAAAGRRLLLRRGDTFTTEGTPSSSIAGATVHIGAFGAPSGEPDLLGRYVNDPVVSLAGTAASQYLTQAAAVTGLTFFHVFFEDAQSGVETHRWGFGPTSWNNSQNSITWHKCAFDGFYGSALIGDRLADYSLRTGLILSRCFIDSTAYGVYMRGRLSAIAGCHLEDTGTHNIRITHAVDFAIHDCPRIGQSGDIGRHSIKLHAQEPGESYPSTRFVSIARNRFASDQNWQVSIGPQDHLSDEFIEDVVCDMNRHDHPGVRNNQATYEVSARNVTIRNATMVDQRASTDYGVVALIHRRGDGLGYYPSGVEVYNVSGLSRRTGPVNYVALLDVQGHDGPVISRSNVLYVPGKDPSFLTPAILAGGMSHDGSHNLVTTSTDPKFLDTTPGEEDLALAEDSPCIDAGAPFGGLSFDHGGLYRPAGDGIDQGAHERGAGAYPWTEGPQGPEGDEEPEGPIGLGINIHRLDESNTSKALINLCKMAAPWRFWDGGQLVEPTEEELDLDGYPIAIPEGISVAVSVVQADWDDERRVPEAVSLGWHRLSYQGSGRVDLVLSKDGATRHNNVPSGFRFRNPNGFIKLELVSIEPSDHLRDFRIVEERFSGQQGISFTPEFLNSLRGFKTIRGPVLWYVDNAYDSARGQLTWAKKTRLSRYTYRGASFDPHAWPPELMVELVNALDGADLYTCIPYLASNDYVEGMIETLAQVEPGRKVWLEYSGEPWMGTAPFLSCAWFRAQAELLFEFDPEDPVEVLMTQLMAHAHHGIRVFEVAKAHEDFDPAVFKFVASYPSWEGEYLYWLQPVLNYTPSATAWKAYLEGVLTNFYWHADWPGAIERAFDIMLDACNDDVDVFTTFYVFSALKRQLEESSNLEAFSTFLTSEGVASGGFYECGPHPNHGFLLSYQRVAEFFELCRGFTRSARQRRMMVWLFNRLRSWLNPGLPACHFADISPYLIWSPWGMAEDTLDHDAPRLGALRSFLADLGAEFPSLQPAYLSPALGPPQAVEIAWKEAPPAAAGFFARMTGSQGTVLLDTQITPGGAWQVVIPETGRPETVAVEISLDSSTWITVPGGFRILRGMRFLGLAFLATQAARGRIGRKP